MGAREGRARRVGGEGRARRARRATRRLTPPTQPLSPPGALELALFLPNSRAAETEADVIGVRLAARCCYDPSAAVTVFSKLGAAEAATGVHTPTLLRTHPLSDARVDRVRKELPAATEEWARAGCAAPRAAWRQFVDVMAGEEREVPGPPGAEAAEGGRW